MRATYYCFTKNGAALNCHNTFEAAMRQARQWKASHPFGRIAVEELERGTNKLVSIQHIEFPMLVPEMTPRHDWEDGFEGTDANEFDRIERAVKGGYVEMYS